LELGTHRDNNKLYGSCMEPERRQITVLFADMVGFTSFSERAGEEATFKLMRSLSKLMDEAVREPGGVVQSFTGDGIMAVFGVPVGFEDAPLRACRAALAILQRIKAAGDDLEVKHGLRPQLRIGVNTGAAVVGRVQEGADAGATVLGDTVNVAARLQALAAPDSVLISEATHRLVQGMVEASFAGELQIKGKSERQRVYRLDAIRLGATRFEAAVSRGLSAFVGRERELEILERGLEKARSQLCVIDLVAEPGMGKSRLLHEFRPRIGKERAFVLSGSCSAHGQQTSFLPFIEVVRGSFRIGACEAEEEVARKLEMGLTALGLHSLRSLGLLLHLFGLKVLPGSLAGLDDLLIGLRTRELLQQLLEARCRLSPVVMMIEDLHWIDSVSEELLGKVVDSEANLRLLVVHTRRPEYVPPWLDRSIIAKLPLEPLPAGDVRRLVQARVGTEVLPEALARQVAEKAEGNPLFAEEIVSYLTERGMLRNVAGRLDFDQRAIAEALPSSVQGLLTARVDSLAPNDRALLQAASVIGRRFDPQILAVAVSETAIDAGLASMQALDLIRPQERSGEFVFKHALVQDALYQSLLTEVRTTLHAKIAAEIERRSGNRLVEVAEVLAHHYSQTAHTGKAFTYLSMAGSKNLGVYSLNEARTHLAAALALLDKHPNCASDDQVAEFLVSHTRLLNMMHQVKATIDVLERHLARVDRLADDPRAVLIRHHYVFALIWSIRYSVAAAVQRETSAMAERLADSKSKAYSLTGEILFSTVVAPKPALEFEELKKEAIAVASQTTDAYIQNWTRFVIAWEQLHRGQMMDARDSARRLMEIGRLLNDPRSTGLGLALLALIALLSDSYAEALECSEQSIVISVAPMDRETAINMKGCALVLLRRTEDGAKLLEQFRRRCFTDGDLYSLSSVDGILGVSEVLQGNIRYGIRLLEEAILRREKEGYRAAADWCRLNLAEVYLQIIGGNEKLSFITLLRNLPILLEVMFTASSRIRSLMARFRENPRFDPAGHHTGRAQMILGLLYKIRKKHTLAVQHLTEARRILSQFGQTPILARVDAALAELGQ
jgi:class 3 adenylate cyclase/tetratricopeptide (TPR) repeat protein